MKPLDTLEQSSVEIKTLGCRLNAYESEVMRQHAEKAGLKDALIINTCSVTNEAERQSRQTVRRAKRDNPHKKIIVTGCSAQLNPQVYEAMEEVDHVLGNGEKMDPNAFFFSHTPKTQVGDIMQVKEGAAHLLGGFQSRVRAFIEIQNGCDHRCTFCSIPFSRGPHRSVPMGALVQQIHHLVQKGYQEVVLTGVDMTDYGKDLPGSPKFSQLVQRILHNVPDLPRLRLSSLDPKEVDDHLIDLFRGHRRLMPHIHLSLQSGDPMILKRMKRRHTPQDAIRVVKAIQSVRPECVFGADIIAGFPTETPEMFQNTLKTLKACAITYLHTFPFSPRQQTPAARMPQVPKEVIKDRARQLRVWGDGQLNGFLASKIGKTFSLLTEANATGHTDDYVPCSFSRETIYTPGDMITVKALSQKDKGLWVEKV